MASVGLGASHTANRKGRCCALGAYSIQLSEQQIHNDPVARLLADAGLLRLSAGAPARCAGTAAPWLCRPHLSPPGTCAAVSGSAPDNPALRLTREFRESPRPVIIALQPAQSAMEQWGNGAIEQWSTPSSTIACPKLDLAQACLCGRALLPDNGNTVYTPPS